MSVRAEIILSVLACKFSSAVIYIPIRVFIVNEPNRRSAYKSLIKALPQIIVIEFLSDTSKNILGLALSFRVQFLELLYEYFTKNVVSGSYCFPAISSVIFP